MNCVTDRNKRDFYRTLGLNPVFGAVFGLCLLFSGALAGQSTAEFQKESHRYHLSSQIEASVTSDGSLTVFSSSLSGQLLQGFLDSLTDSRRRRGNTANNQSSLFLVKEGQSGGQRGFSSGADDDADGLVDEDQLDGRDNDGDGLIDEDFAAISDAMTVVNLLQRGGRAQLDFMQWAGPRLQGALFLNLAATHELSGVTVPYYHLKSAGNSWREIDVFSRYHDLAGRSQTSRATAFVVRMVNHGSSLNQARPSSFSAVGPSAATWVGVLVLDQSSQASNGGRRRPKLQGETLSLPLSDNPLAAVVCTASSWSQLNRLLLDALSVYQGVTDPVNNQQAHWIVSPLCSRCRLEKTVNLTVLQVKDDGFALQFALESGLSGLMDPDLFVLDNVPLGAPVEILWKPDSGPSKAVSWSLATEKKLQSQYELQGDLYGLLGDVVEHEAQGSLLFKFSNPAERDTGWLEPGMTLNLEGTWLDGRNFVTQGPVVELLEAAVVDEIKPSKLLGTMVGHGKLALAASLLEGWPNPFQDQIKIEFVVPTSVREAFEWSVEKPLPQGVDMSAPVDWSGGQPSVSVKIYSINGQELVSLQQGTLGQGQYTVTWNGTDSTGRKVASGTYFCKLQMDKWSVTRRLVFLR